MSIKGNIVVGQSGGPTAVINNSLVGVIHEAMQHEEFGEILGMSHGIAGILNEELVDLRRESAETLALLRDTPASALGTVRYKVSDADYERILNVFRTYDVRYFFYIGGNDSMDTAHQMHALAASRGYELHAIGVPKTVDNDLAETDHCPGFGSAARFVATAIRDTGYDTVAMGDSSPIKFMEIMGRNAGWLTASAALAKEEPDDAPHLVYVPEHGVTLEQILGDIQGVYDRLGHCVVAVSEGLADPEGNPLAHRSDSGEVDAFGHGRLGGVVEFLDEAVSQSLGLRARFDKPGYLQRSFAWLQSSVDREEAYEVGRAAVRAALAGESDKMITLVREPGPTYRCTMGLADLEQVANHEHILPADYINETGNGVTDGFLAYARPLIGGPLPPYAKLARHLLPKRPSK
ncbi:MAG: 6-phosphofructokinase [Chloroflexi bacterium]|nr:6-phosphofructokinase [Chloroflexota bacterium]